MNSIIAIGLALLCFFVSNVHCNRVLTDATFEHLTQASTGSTTGIWLVRFCGSESEDCVENEPIWREVQQEMLEHQIFLVDVDVESNPILKSRFEVDFYPMYAKFKNGYMYSRVGGIEKESFIEWILQDWDKDDAFPVPKDPSAPVGSTLGSSIQDAIGSAGDQMQDIINNAMAKYYPSGKDSMLAKVSMIALPLLVVSLVNLLRSLSRASRKAVNPNKKKN